MEFFLRQIYPWLIEISSFSPVLPFITGLLLFRKKKSWQFRLLFMFVAFLVTSEALGWLTIYLGTKNNSWLLHLFTPLEFVFLSAIYYLSFKQPVLRKGITYIAILFVLFSLFYSLNVEGVHQMNSIARMIGNALLILYAISYFYKVANNLGTIYLDRDAIFLLSCAILIYKAGSSMSYALFNQALAESYDAARICLAILLILNIFFSAGLVVILRRTTAI